MPIASRDACLNAAVVVLFVVAALDAAKGIARSATYAWPPVVHRFFCAVHR